MSRSTPSLLALLGLVAVAGYQNRGRISEMLADARQRSAQPALDGQQAEENQGSRGFLSEIAEMFGAGTAGSTISSGIGELVTRFKDSGRAGPADSWVSSGENMPLNVAELEAALGSETLDELSQRTGLSHNTVLLRLNTALPEVVNRFTPDGRLPTEAEARAFG